MKDVPEKGFFYRDSTHTYALDGVKMTGVTTVLGHVGDKSALMQWYANLAAVAAFTSDLDKEAFARAVAQYKKVDTRAANELDKQFPAFKQARTAATRVRDAAGDSGTEAHLICELFERGDRDALSGTQWSEEGKRRARVYIDWYKSNVKKTHFVERPLFSRTHFLGGTPDGGIEMNSGLHLLNDKKFKPSIYDPSAFRQMGAYRMMLEEMETDKTTPIRIEWKDGTIEMFASPKEYLASFDGVNKWDGAIILRVGENDFEEMMADTYEEDKEGFLAALTLYRQDGAFKNRVMKII